MQDDNLKNEKDFDVWNSLKKKINNSKRVSHNIKPKEFWWASIGLNVGSEIDGKGGLFTRPVLILKKIRRNSYLVIPGTTKEKVGFLYFKINFENGIIGYFCLDQIKTLNYRRFYEKYCEENISEEMFTEIKGRIKSYYFSERFSPRSEIGEQGIDTASHIDDIISKPNSLSNKNVNFISQYSDINSDEWRSRGCTISATYMAIKYLQKDFDLSIDELLDEAIKIKAFDFENGGWWKHDRVCVLMHNHGVLAYAEEFKSIPFGIETKYADILNDKGLQKVFNHIESGGLVIVSIPKNLIEIGKHHSILIHSVKTVDGKKIFIFNDSEKIIKEEGQNLEIEFETFKNIWRRLAIFVG